MKFQHRWVVTVFSLIALSASSLVNAALLSRLSGQAYYDTSLNITWLANANLAASNTFGVSGIDGFGSMDWDTAQNWIGAMNTANYFGYSDWRLPMLRPLNGISTDTFPANIYDGSADYGFNVTAPGTMYAGSTASEMAHLFYNTLGNLAYYDTGGNLQLGSGVTNSGPFSNIKLLYHFGTEVEYDPSAAWLFGFKITGVEGLQAPGGKSNILSAWAVRSGDITAVPVPAAVWLFGSGLLGLIGFFRQPRRR